MKYYYSLAEVNTVDFIPYTNNSTYSGISMTRLMDRTYTKYKNGQISFVGYRLNALAPFSSPKYHETITLQTPHGMLVASQVYNDPGNGFETTIDSLNYMIHNGTGSFIGKKWLKINFYNNITPKKRIITIF